MRFPLMKIFYWLLGLFTAYLIYETIRKILGGSLGFEQLVIGFLLANTAYIIGLHRKLADIQKDIGDIKSQLSEHLGWHKGIKERR